MEESKETMEDYAKELEASFRSIKEGDIITIDIPNNAISVDVSDEELARRRAQWQPRQPRVTTGYLSRYAKQVSSGMKGAVLS